MTAEYVVAVHAIVFLNHKGQYESSDEIAKNVCTNPVRVRRVLAKLEKAGLVDVKNGSHGGYMFIRDPGEITLLDILTAVDERIVNVKWHSGDVDMDCEVASGMSAVMDDVFLSVEKEGRMALADIHISDIDGRLFNRK